MEEIEPMLRLMSTLETHPPGRRAGCSAQWGSFRDVVGLLHFFGGQATDQAALLKDGNEYIVGVEIHLF